MALTKGNLVNNQGLIGFAIIPLIHGPNVLFSSDTLVRHYMM